ncbi:CopG family transcriptional regulator [Phocaeicola vulgatus]|uniref:CopG family transcriptional regulator n=1 Tax=Phocaeicola vulgatus TaxID=821 RepID=A0AAW4UWU7_PHOVU|nr:CopG family transcriptional regulator [Phocaeicola vulgatus]MBU9914891.1 CopG family transcriptional regulator [Phocaeicola vulgatus]MBV4405032.1 CopG family transcriptional regulator [Phocaeicola vulgatus]MCB6274794.1 CopG family transcriptional regulator [Phocaeicola vulgatus]MCB6279335.1 CopG family transcriptional regulator [Phocaeicola vulgatus]MCB6291483.1 CopG family transcriptional regulator [Phocaeicola vulgatus]
MGKIKVKVDWCGKNFGAVTEENVLCGMVVTTSKSYEGLMDELAVAVREHIEGLVRGDYEFDVELGMAALLRKCEQFTSLAAISRASGINQQQLSHYASGLRTPRQEQRKRIIDGIHRIGQEFLSVV